MNQRIIELMLEAGKTIPGDKHIDADFCKKFAELIVQECIDYCGENLSKTVGAALKIHFGVEE